MPKLDIENTKDELKQYPTTTPTTTGPIITQRDILWRDFAFLILAGIALRIVAYVEIHAADTDRLFSSSKSSTTTNEHNNPPTQTIVDAGFVITAPLHDFLSVNLGINDFLAMLNSVLLFPPIVYATYVTLWLGDYTLSFRLLATQLFRSFCGWFTYLPPDPTFLMSVYDFPEIVQCLFSDDCANTTTAPLPFVSFFSGHVACTVIIANHLFTRGHKRSAVSLHVFNVFQMVRLLATRGHYSIDIIIGWCVAVNMSNVAGKLGLSYSRGFVHWRALVPKTGMDAFKTVTGVTDLRKDEDELIQTETTAKIAAQMAGDFAIRSLSELRKDVELLGITIEEIHILRRHDLIRLLSWANLKAEELKAEARLLEVNLPKEFVNDKEKIIEFMWMRAKTILGEKRVNWLRAASPVIDSVAESSNGNTAVEDITDNNGHKKDL